ncbi:hypothetical protein HPB49_016068 [Dermacentor silvarum]|uniref:Uncharacterized protein n=1 Tax=Dermacentor silvarum TaxID=543639 RepID=A0ACB8CG73_DERSI|nr:hypothetical protein HPB49_016068 [Dermacentor silvarum]
MCSTESVLRRAVIKYLNPTFSAKYFRRDNVLAIVTLSSVAVEFQPACSLVMNVLPPAPALPGPSSVTHSHIRTSFVCTVRAANYCTGALAVVHQHSLLNGDSLFLTVQRSQNKPNTIIVRKRPRRENRQRFVPFVAPLQPQVTDDDLPPREYTVLYRPVARRSHFLAASGDAIAAFLSGVPGAHRVRPNLRRNVVAVDTLPGEDLTALLAVRVICDVRVRAKALILNTCTGTLFDVDPTFDGATIFEGLESSVPVVAIARSGDVVTLRFAGDVVPEEVLLFRRRRAVRPRLPRPLQCGRCGLFGHATVTCSRDPRCLQCAGRHPTNSCTVDRRRCLHCGGPHAATEPRCPQWQLERRVAATLASSKPRITRKQALELARSSGAAVIDSSKQRPAGQRATESRPLSSRRQPGLSYSAALTGGTQADSSISGGVGEPPVTDNNPVQPPGATAPVTSVLVLTALASALRSLLELAPRRLASASHVCGGIGNA